MDNMTETYQYYPEYKAGVLILKTVPPILIIFGTVGNCLSLVVLTRRSIRKSTTSLFLICLTISDLVVLYTGLLRHWLINLLQFDIRRTGEAVCKLHMWIVYSSLDFSAWMFILLTLERIHAVWSPMQFSSKTNWNRRNASIVIILLSVFSLGLNSHMLYGIGNKGKRKCVSLYHQYSLFFRNIWTWIDLCVYCLIPLAVIAVGNSLILFKIYHNSRELMRRQSSISAMSRSSQHNRRHHQASMTVVLITMNTAFLITTLPISVYDIGYTHWSMTTNQRSIAQLELWWAIVNMLMYSNNALNFLFFLSGSHFRKEFKSIFRRKRLKLIQRRSYCPELSSDRPSVHSAELCVGKCTSPTRENDALLTPDCQQ